jgi:hypothetical protein
MGEWVGKDFLFIYAWYKYNFSKLQGYLCSSSRVQAGKGNICTLPESDLLILDII